jgi:hypothetical protein
MRKTIFTNLLQTIAINLLLILAYYLFLQFLVGLPH